MPPKKSTKKSASAKKTRGTRRSSQPTRARKVATKIEPAVSPDSGKLNFNHSMIYVKDVERGLNFYRDLLGFKLIEDFLHEGKPVYARLRAPGGEGTIALHHAEAGVSLASDGVRLYFEVRELDDFCGKLRKKGFYINQMPRMMPWGWRHAYLNDPDGHEISLYWAGENRMKKTMLKAIEKAAERKPE
jgi:catechol 2,3-dioxygenase-like lactoylglutathione lyase family enzyme